MVMTLDSGSKGPGSIPGEAFKFFIFYTNRGFFLSKFFFFFFSCFYSYKISPFLGFINHFGSNLIEFHGVVVITSALHAEGLGFNPRWD